MNIDLSTLTKEDLHLIHFADPRMTTKPPHFDFEKDGEFALKLADIMFEKMREYGGAGLSANQVGLPYRMFVFGNEEKYWPFFNPAIVSVSKEQELMSEGCLSFPGFYLTLSRPKHVVITYQDIKGEFVTAQYSDIAARIILHEYDHMEGINFTQHASTFKLKWELEKIKKKQKKILRKIKNARQ